jgi:molybdopterin-containing oxidoreductase family iron-sulfur binding subunit
MQLMKQQMERQLTFVVNPVHFRKGDDARMNHLLLNLKGDRWRSNFHNCNPVYDSRKKGAEVGKQLGIAKSKSEPLATNAQWMRLHLQCQMVADHGHQSLE